AALRGHVVRLQDARRVDAVEARGPVAGGDEQAEQAGVVEIAVESRDAPASAPAAFLPVAAGRRVEARGQEAVIGGRVRAVAGLAEEAEEVGLRRQVLYRRELQPVQCDMRGVE